MIPVFPSSSIFLRGHDSSLITRWIYYRGASRRKQITRIPWIFFPRFLTVSRFLTASLETEFLISEKMVESQISQNSKRFIFEIFLFIFDVTLIKCIILCENWIKNLYILLNCIYSINQYIFFLILNESNHWYIRSFFFNFSKNWWK